MQKKFWQNTRIVIRCSQCKGKLRVPLDKGKINVTCPNCKSQFMYNPDSIVHTLKQIFLSIAAFTARLLKMQTIRRSKH